MLSWTAVAHLRSLKLEEVRCVCVLPKWRGVMETLDGSNVTLMERDLVIADKDKPLCLAGVMGGIDSGVTGDY